MSGGTHLLWVIPGRRLRRRRNVHRNSILGYLRAMKTSEVNLPKGIEVPATIRARTAYRCLSGLHAGSATCRRADSRVETVACRGTESVDRARLRFGGHGHLRPGLWGARRPGHTALLWVGYRVFTGSVAFIVASRCIGARPRRRVGLGAALRVAASDSALVWRGRRQPPLMTDAPSSSRQRPSVSFRWASG
jgi:hypothetical protein